MNYYTNQLNRVTGQMQIKVTGENGTATNWLTLNEESRAALIEWLTPPAPNLLHFTRIKNDTCGNPRYVLHYTQLLRPDEQGLAPAP